MGKLLAILSNGLPIRQADRLKAIFPEAVCQMLASAGIMPLGGARPIDLTRGIFEDR